MRAPGAEAGGGDPQHESRAEAGEDARLAAGQPSAEADAASIQAPGFRAAAVEVLVATDVCLRALEGRGAPLGLPLLLNYDFPARMVRFWPRTKIR